MGSASGQTIVTNALTTLGVVGQGEIPSVSDSNDALQELNSMWEGWGIDEGIIFAVQATQYVWPTSTPSVAIGPGATSPFNVALPTRLYGAYWIPSSGPRVPIKIVGQQEYSDHRDLGATTALSPDELYADWLVGSGTGQSNLSLWPVPTAAGHLELNAGAPFSTWTISGTYNMPLGYQDAINYGLAFRLIPRYGMSIQPQITQSVTELAQKTEARIRQMNLINRQLPKGTEENPITLEAEAAQAVK